MIKVGDKVRVVDVPKGFDLEGVGVGSVGKVVSLKYGDTVAAVFFEGLSNLVAFTDRAEYLKTVGRGFRSVFLVQRVEENLPWFKTSKGIEWLYKNFPEAPKELQTYRHGQVFLVSGVISGYAEPYMLVSCVEVGRHTMVNLNTGRCLAMLPYTEEVTYSDVYEMFGGLNFSLVADSVEEYYKEKLNV